MTEAVPPRSGSAVLFANSLLSSTRLSSSVPPSGLGPFSASPTSLQSSAGGFSTSGLALGFLSSKKPFNAGPTSPGDFITESQSQSVAKLSSTLSDLTRHVESLKDGISPLEAESYGRFEKKLQECNSTILQLSNDTIGMAQALQQVAEELRNFREYALTRVELYNTNHASFRDTLTMLQNHLNHLEQDGTRDAAKTAALVESQVKTTNTFQESLNARMDKLIQAVSQDKKQRNDMQSVVTELKVKLERSQRVYFWRSFLEVFLLFCVLSLILYPTWLHSLVPW
eukprot:TRINITY_DN6309_c0_g1_i1.p1 TRINITY_DN6309_c0_g1~~TRINITY_DN6309_c0_g1_i1.p1  ORF type:complete len:304 (+),score=47.90 TRINITY_DN6309_c0_g1_i1:63-914(+)